MREISERIATGDRAAVPAFWRHEVLNALLTGERRKRLTPELIQAFNGLTAYDAAYLEIAMRERCALATVDRDLENATRAEGVEVL